MAMDNKIVGAVTGTGADVNAARQLQVVTETDAINNSANIGGARIFSEVDQGYQTGTPRLYSPEADNDYRLRVSQDITYDEEVFNYTAQNTGKHAVSTSGISPTWTVNGLSYPSPTTAGNAILLKTYAAYPNTGTQTLSFDAELSFSTQPAANCIYEFGLFGAATTVSSAPTDGIFFRLTSAGLQGVSSNGGTETNTGVFTGPGGSGTWTYTNSKNYQFIAYCTAVAAMFWANDGSGAILLGSIPLPAGQPRMVRSSGLVAGFAVRASGTAASAPSMLIGAYNVRVGGSSATTIPSTSGNRTYGSYQGFGGGTMGSLANFANSANPTAAVPTNTTAALGTGLGGQFWETDTLAVTTDGIIQSYQVPAGTIAIQGRRLVIRGVKIQSYIQTAITGGGYNAVWSLAFGHTAVSLATAEGAATKAPRRIPMGIQSVAAGATALTMLQDIWLDLGDAPVFVNPGEFVACVKKKVGTAPSAGVVAHNVTFVYGWE
jgi:hypothetical protein